MVKLPEGASLNEIRSEGALDATKLADLKAPGSDN
jgi:hypothetical protein